MKRLLIIIVGVVALSTNIVHASEEPNGPISASALGEMRQAAERGDPIAQFELGDLYAQGQVVPEDDKEAVKWFRKAADQGNGHAQTSLGIMYEEGRGVPKDYNAAIKWYRKAAEQGDESGRKFLEFSIPDACHSDDQCMLVYSCGDAAINKNHIDTFNASSCRQTSKHNPNATARCLNGQCRAAVSSCHDDNECAVVWGECGDRAVRKENMSQMQPAVRSCSGSIAPHNADTTAHCIKGKCSLSE